MVAERKRALATLDAVTHGHAIVALQAGRARILAGQTKLGLPSLRRGLELFAQRGQWQKLHQMGQRVIGELSARGLSAEASEVESLLKNLSPSIPVIESPPAKKPILPTHCPSCGASLRPDEFEWLDDVTAQCAYCGSPVRETN